MFNPTRLFSNRSWDRWFLFNSEFECLLENLQHFLFKNQWDAKQQMECLRNRSVGAITPVVLANSARVAIITLSVVTDFGTRFLEPTLASFRAESELVRVSVFSSPTFGLAGSGFIGYRESLKNNSTRRTNDGVRFDKRFLRFGAIWRWEAASSDRSNFVVFRWPVSQFSQ